MVTIVSGALILLVALMLSVGGLALIYRFVPVSLLQAHYGATGAIYAALYVMFGISLGFALFLVWQQYEAARLTVEAEAAALQRIYWQAENFPDPERSDVQELAVSYARGEVQEEWPLMGKGRVSPHAEQRAHQLARAVRELGPKTTVQSELYADALGRMDVLRENRTLRTTEVREGHTLGCVGRPDLRSGDNGRIHLPLRDAQFQTARGGHRSADGGRRPPLCSRWGYSTTPSTATCGWGLERSS